MSEHISFDDAIRHGLTPEEVHAHHDFNTRILPAIEAVAYEVLNPPPSPAERDEQATTAESCRELIAAIRKWVAEEQAAEEEDIRPHELPFAGHPHFQQAKAIARHWLDAQRHKSLLFEDLDQPHRLKPLQPGDPDLAQRLAHRLLAEHRKYQRLAEEEAIEKEYDGLMSLRDRLIARHKDKSYTQNGNAFILLLQDRDEFQTACNAAEFSSTAHEFMATLDAAGLLPTEE